MVLAPFKNERVQRVASAITALIGVLVMGSENIRYVNIFGLRMNMFVIGMFIAFIAMLYFLDV